MSLAWIGIAWAQPVADPSLRRLPEWARALAGSGHVSQLATDSRHRRAVWIQPSPMSPAALARQLAPVAGHAGAGLVRQQAVRGWQAVSGWSDGALAIVQCRPHGRGSLIVTALLEPLAGIAPNPSSALPAWLAFLPTPWTQRVMLDGQQVVTVAAQLAPPIATAHQLITDKAMLAGLTPAANGAQFAGPATAGQQDARLLVLRGRGREALVTLVAARENTERMLSTMVGRLSAVLKKPVRSSVSSSWPKSPSSSARGAAGSMPPVNCRSSPRSICWRHS